MALSARHCDLLEARGLDLELLERLGLSNGKRGSDWLDIPYFWAGKIVNTKHRTIAGEKKFYQETGGRKCFWNIDCLADQTLADLPLVITEGELDAISALQSGFPRTVSVPDGAPAEELGVEDKGRKYSYLDDARSLLRDVREIIIASDNDGPGINLLNDLAIRLGKHRTKWVRYPVGCKDLNDALMKFGQRGVAETLNRAQWMKVDGVYRMSELPPVNEAHQFNIGIAGIDRHYRIRRGDFCVVVGIPGHGKTTFVNEIAARMASPPHDWNVAVASFEQKPQRDHRRMLRTFRNRKSVIYQSEAELAEADQWIDDRFAFIVPDEDDDVTLDWLTDRIEAAIVQRGCDLVIVDPYNEMDHVRPDGMTLTEYTGFAIKRFRKIAAKYQVHLIVVAHPAKIARGKDGKVPMPNLYDTSDSAHFANKADIGVIIHRKDDGHTLIRIAKTRYYDAIGEPGDLNATYLREQARYQIIDPAALI